MIDKNCIQQTLNQLKKDLDKTALPADPAVNRLLEGFAYLSADVRQHIQQRVPELAQTLLRRLWPQALSPLPAISLVQLEMPMAPMLIQKGALLSSHPADAAQVPVKFTVVDAVQTLPLSLHARISNENCLVWQFSKQADFPSEKLQDITLTIVGDALPAKQAFYALFNAVKACTLQIGDKEIALTSPCSLAQPSTKALALWQRYFHCPLSYLQFNLQGLGAYMDDAVTDFSLHIDVAADEQCLQSIKQVQFLLHCACIENNYQTAAEPIALLPWQDEYPLLLDKGCHLLQLDKLEAHVEANPDAAILNPSQDYCLVQNGEASILKCRGAAMQAYTRLSSLVSVCQDSTQLQSLYDGDSLYFVELPEVAQLIYAPTPMLPPKQWGDGLWQLLHYLSFVQRPFDNSQDVRALLTYSNGSADEAAKRRIAGVRYFTHKERFRLKQGCVCRELQCELHLDEVQFDSIGDCYLFASCFWQYVQCCYGDASALSLHVLCWPSQRCFDFKTQYDY